jgi:hypothetical protein
MIRKRKTNQTLTDPRLDPFFITVDDYCFTIKEKVISDGNHFKSNGKTKKYERSLFYLPSLDTALVKIAELKAGTEDFDSLKEYLKNYETIKNQIKEYTYELRSII